MTELQVFELQVRKWLMGRSLPIEFVPPRTDDRPGVTAPREYPLGHTETEKPPNAQSSVAEAEEGATIEVATATVEDVTEVIL